MNAETLHVQLVFQVIKAFFDGIFVAVHHKRLKGVFDIVGQQCIKSGIPVAVFLYSFVVEEHLTAPHRGLLDNEEGFVGIFVTADDKPLFKFFLVAKKLFGKAVGDRSGSMSIVIDMEIAAFTALSPRIQPRMNIQDLSVDLLVPIGVLNALANLVNDRADPGRTSGNSHEELVPGGKKFIDILLAVKAPIQNQVQPRIIEITEGLKEVVQVDTSLTLPGNRLKYMGT